MRAVVTVLLVLFIASCTEKKVADFIFYNGNIWTGDSANPSASVIAIKGNQIIYTGTEYATYQGEKTIMEDLEGRFVTPGFIDNHVHFLSGGYNLGSVQLKAIKTKQAFIDAIKTYCEKQPPGTWILGGNWDHEAWGGELPLRSWVDSITGDHPILLSRYDGHESFTNTLALTLCGINKSTPAPPGGAILYEAGILKDKAQDLVLQKIPPFTPEQLDQFLKQAMQEAVQNGITQVYDVCSFGGWQDLETFQRAAKMEALQVRIYGCVPLSDWSRLDSFCDQNGKGDDWLRWGGLKGYVDGSLGSTTAWFYSPYLDAPQTNGLVITDTNDLRKWVTSADAAGLQISLHAIGDRANDYALELYRHAAVVNGTKDRRFRIEHAQHLSKDAAKKFVQQQVTASMQPYHAIDDGKWAYKRLEDDRLQRTYMFNTLIQEGAVVSFGSDWDVAPLNAIMGIYAAVTRRTLDDKNPGGWYPAEKVTVEQALKCYTQQNAFASFMENKTGVLKKGMLADFVILSDDLLTMQPELIKNVTVIKTIVNGKVVYTAGEK